MAKERVTYTCSQCAHREPRWLGQCPHCGSWNTLLETPKGKSRSSCSSSPIKTPFRLESISKNSIKRIDSGICEVNRVLGGGIMRGAATLVGGEPGIGKSTLMLQTAFSMKTSETILYLSGEETPEQIKNRALRLGFQSEENLLFFCETEVSLLIAALNREKPAVVIIDSIQTLYLEEVGKIPGSLNQIRLCCHELVEWCRECGAALFFVAHVTKEGSIAGPKTIEHIVDTVLYFEHGEGEARFLRATKNRHGSIDEIGFFSMREEGLKQLENTDTFFTSHREGATPPGVVIAPVYEGTRSFLVEIQALTVPAKGSTSRVFSERFDSNRVSRIAAVLEKQLGVSFSDQDIYVNFAGGLKVNEVGIELPLALALFSARVTEPLPPYILTMGELTLAGEIRPIPHTKRRIQAGKERGFKTFITPTVKESGDGRVIVKNIKEVIEKVFNLQSSG